MYCVESELGYKVHYKVIIWCRFHYIGPTRIQSLFCLLYLRLSIQRRLSHASERERWWGSQFIRDMWCYRPYFINSKLETVQHGVWTCFVSFGNFVLRKTGQFLLFISLSPLKKSFLIWFFYLFFLNKTY